MEMEKRVETKKGIFSIRPYQPQDQINVLLLWKAAFGKGLSREQWQWKYLGNPFGYRIMLCVTEDQVPIAMYSGIPYKALYEKMEVSFIHPMDNMSHPSYRSVLSGRKGLFVMTAEHFFSMYGGPHDSIFMYGFPGERHFRLGQLLLKYKSFYAGCACFKISSQDVKSKYKLWTGKIDHLDKPYAWIDNFFYKSSKYYPFIVKRNSEFIGWRFFDHPSNEYKIYIYKSFLNKIKGYAVLLIKGQVANIVDFLCIPEKDIVKNFFYRIFYELKKENLCCFQIWIPGNHFLCSEFIRAGFESQKEPIGIIPVGRTFYDKLSFEYAEQNIYYTMADGDLF